MSSEDKLRATIERLKRENDDLKVQLEAKNAASSDTEEMLQRRLAKAQEDKAKIVMQLEQEEEFLTNTLQKKLNKLRKDKIDMENQLEQEQEFIVNKLQKRLAEVLIEKNELEKKLEDDSGQLAKKLQENVRRLQAEKAALSTSLEVEEEALINKMSRELDALQDREKQAKSDLENYKLKYNQLKKDHEKLEADNFLLTQKLRREKERVSEILKEKGHIESDLEMDTERMFNARAMSPLPGRIGSPRGSNAPSTSQPASPLLVGARARMMSLGESGLSLDINKTASPPRRISTSFSPSPAGAPLSPNLHSGIPMPMSPSGAQLPPTLNLAASVGGASGDDEA